MLLILKQKVKEKIAADIIKRKGDVSKSDDRYAYESVEVVSEGPLGALAGGALGAAVGGPRCSCWCSIRF